jgi:hypothetical protein
MLVLAAADTIAGVADAASKVTYTIFGMTLVSGVEAYSALAQGQLANSAATIYTAPNPGQAFIKSVLLVNGDTVSHTFQLFRGGTAAANAISPVFTLAAGSMGLYEDGSGWQFYSASGQVLQSAYSVISPLDNWGIAGCKAETMDRNVCPEVNTTAGTTGQIRIQAIWLTAGTVVSNISFCSATSAATLPTHYAFGLYDLAGNLLATTADQTSTAWGANTLKTIATTAAYTVPSTGLYYLAFMCTASTTVPTLKGGTARTGGQLLAVSPILAGISATAYVTGTSPVGISIPSAASTASIWGCVS